MKLSTQAAILVTLVTLRHVILTKFPKIVYGKTYLIMFGIAFGLTYSITKNFKYSLTLGLLTVLGRMVYRYKTDEKEDNSFVSTLVFALGTATVLTLSNLFKTYQPSIDYVLYASLLYTVLSVTEWVIHRYIMHCYQNMPQLLNVPGLKTVCSSHHNHHLTVKEDMSLKNNNHDSELVFSWGESSSFILFIFPIMFALTCLLNIKVGAFTNLACVSFSAFIHMIIWNSEHTRMHDKKVDVPFVPYINNVPDGMYYPLLRNHELHHKIKGDEKGNFNIVILGADEFLGTRN